MQLEYIWWGNWGITWPWPRYPYGSYLYLVRFPDPLPLKVRWGTCLICTMLHLINQIMKPFAEVEMLMYSFSKVANIFFTDFFSSRTIICVIPGVWDLPQKHCICVTNILIYSIVIVTIVEYSPSAKPSHNLFCPYKISWFYVLSVFPSVPRVVIRYLSSAELPSLSATLSSAQFQAGQTLMRHKIEKWLRVAIVDNWNQGALVEHLNHEAGSRVKITYLFLGSKAQKQVFLLDIKQRRKSKETTEVTCTVWPIVPSYHRPASSNQSTWLW